MSEHIDPFFKDNKDRFVIFPVKHNDIWDFYKQIKSAFWTADEIDLHQDLQDWNKKLSEQEREHIKYFLALLSRSNRNIDRNFVGNLAKGIQFPEARFFIDFQLMMLNTHSETISLFIDTYTKDDGEKEKLFGDIESSSENKKGYPWTRNWNNSSIADNLIAFAAIENLEIAMASYTLLGLKKRDLLPGLTFSGELISRDKALYRDFAVHLHNHHLVKKVPDNRIRQIILDTLSMAHEFMNRASSASFFDTDAKSTVQYLEFITDELLVKLSCEKEFGSAFPFEMQNSTGQGKGILEKRAGEFRKTVVQNKEQDTNIKKV